jgi:serine protease AprX
LTTSIAIVTLAAIGWSGRSRNAVAVAMKTRGVRWGVRWGVVAVSFVTVGASVAGPAAAVSARSATPPPASLGYDPLTDTGGLSAITRMIKAQALWAMGYTGKGVGVAVIDTGITPVAGLDTAGQVVDGPDLSFDSQVASLAHLDGYGHGTHIASIIAGHDRIDRSLADASRACANCLNGSPFSDTTKFVGVAPESTLINVKVGASDGSVDVSQVVAGIDWTVAHRDDPGLNIKVINLSYGTNSAQRYGVDPIAFAAENAWKHGIVVVAAGGNDGETVRNLADPGYDPSIIAVGASDPMGTLDPADDTVPAWANHGTHDRPVDVTAPGVHVLGLRVPGSVVDQANPGAVVGSRFIRGSGTSQATAVVSGVVALLRQRFPDATPDMIKAMLRSAARHFGRDGDGEDDFRGRGVVNAEAVESPRALGIAQRFADLNPARGTGSLDKARGGVDVIDHGIALTGEQDIFGAAWDPSAWSVADVGQTAWVRGTWRGAKWAGAGFNRNGDWSTTKWKSTDWAGEAWTYAGKAPRWSGSRWSGSRWSGSRWSGSRWSGSRWSGSRWS